MALAARDASLAVFHCKWVSPARTAGTDRTLSGPCGAKRAKYGNESMREEDIQFIQVYDHVWKWEMNSQFIFAYTQLRVCVCLSLSRNPTETNKSHLLLLWNDTFYCGLAESL